MVNLKKGQKISLKKDLSEHQDLRKFTLGLGWDVLGEGVDLDAHAIAFDAEHKKVFHTYFFKQSNPGVVLSGDNLTGSGEGIDEYMWVDLDKVPEHVTCIEFYINMFTAGVSFADVSNAFVCGFTDNENKRLFQFDLSSYNPGILLVKACMLQKNNGEWTFEGSGEGYTHNIDKSVTAPNGTARKGLFKKLFG